MIGAYVSGVNQISLTKCRPMALSSEFGILLGQLILFIDNFVAWIMQNRKIPPNRPKISVIFYRSKSNALLKYLYVIGLL